MVRENRQIVFPHGATGSDTSANVRAQSVPLEKHAAQMIYIAMDVPWEFAGLRFVQPQVATLNFTRCAALRG